MNRLPVNIKFVLNSFFVAVFVNSAVITAHILTAQEYGFAASLEVLLYTMGISIILFATTFLVLGIFSYFLTKLSREKAFWILMLFGIITAILLFVVFEGLFAKYTDEPIMMCSVAVFTMLISLSSQYQLLTEANETI